MLARWSPGLQSSTYNRLPQLRTIDLFLSFFDVVHIFILDKVWRRTRIGAGMYVLTIKGVQTDVQQRVLTVTLVTLTLVCQGRI